MRRPSRQVLVTIVSAVLGLAVAVGLALLTSSLSTQQVGLAGESPGAGRSLVAPPASTTTRVRPKPDRPTTTRTVTVTVTSPSVPPPVTHSTPPPSTTPYSPPPTQTTGSGSDHEKVEREHGADD